MYGIYDDGVVIAQFAAPMSFRSNRPVFASDTLSLKRQTAFQGAQRWELQTNLVPLTHGAQDLMILLVTKGHSDPITINVPQNYGVMLRNTSSGEPFASGASNAGSVQVLNNGGLIPRGSFVRFASHTKVYMTLNDLSGDGELNIFPNLRAALSYGTRLYCRDDVIMPCLLDSNTVTGMSYTDGIMMDNGVLTFLEKL